MWTTSRASQRSNQAQFTLSAAIGRKYTALLKSLPACFLLICFSLLLGCVSTSTEETQKEADPIKAAKIYVQLGYGYVNNGNIEQAKRKLGRALELAPKLPEAHDAIAYLYSKIGENQLALTHYRRAVELAPDNSRLNNNYGTYLCRVGRFTEAEEYFLNAVANPLYETPDQAYQNAGLCAMEAGNRTKAKDYFEKALFHNSNSAHALVELATINFDLGNVVNAKSYLEQFMAIYPENKRAIELGMKIAKSTGDRGTLNRLQHQLGKGQ